MKVDDIRVFPIPVADKLYFEMLAADNSSTDIQIFDISGRLLRQEASFQNNLLKVNIGNIPSGLYQLQFIAGNKVMNKIIVVEK